MPRADKATFRPTKRKFTYRDTDGDLQTLEGVTEVETQMRLKTWTVTGPPVRVDYRPISSGVFMRFEVDEGANRVRFTG